MKYGLFLYYSGESATCLNTPVLKCDEIPVEITHPMMVEIVRGQDNNRHPDVNFNAMDMQELATFMQEDLCLSMNSVAVIEESQFDVIEQIGDALLETMEDDSSTYRAAEVFGKILQNKSVSIISFPEGDGEVNDDE